MKVLIVDDSKAMRMIVRNTLKQAGFSGFNAIEAGNGAEGLAAIEKENPDLVLSDWNMPEMNGIEMLEKLQEEGRSIHFGFVSSESNPSILKRATDANAEFFITKPFTAEKFQTALEPIFASVS